MKYCKLFLQSLLIYWTFSIFQISADTNNNSNREETLQLVQMIFRHGDKTPVTPFPNDPYRSLSFWPGGWNNITEKGKRRLYNLGIYFRKRYSTLLSREYLQDELKVLSSDYDRTITSAMCFLTGFYRDNNLESHNQSHQWDGHLDWESVPIEVLAKTKDRILDVSEHCPRMEKILFDAVYNSEYAKQFLKDNKEIVDYIVKHSGITAINLLKITFVWNTLKIEAEHELELAPWTKRVLDSEPLSRAQMGLLKYVHKNKAWTSLRAGPLTLELISRMEENVQRKNENKPGGNKMILYAGHDRTITDLMLALNIYDKNIKSVPHYGSTLIFELHRIENKYFVEVLYKNDSSTTPHKLVITGCGNPCDLNDFKAISNNFIPKNWTEDCQLANQNNFAYSIEDTLKKENDNEDNQLMSLLLCCTLIIFGIGGMIFEILR